jgi:pimeloyl-ACP methyl ester carboxylesterase
MKVKARRSSPFTAFLGLGAIFAGSHRSCAGASFVLIYLGSAARRSRSCRAHALKIAHVLFWIWQMRSGSNVFICSDTRWEAGSVRARQALQVRACNPENGGFRGPYPRGAMLHTLRCIYGLDFAEHGRVVASLEVPTLVAYCENDPLIEVPIFEELQALAKPGPRLRYADGAHNPQKAHAVELGAAISAFVAQPTKQG